MPARAIRISACLALALACAAGPAAAAPDPDGVRALLAQARAISDRDGGRFWGKTLYGPILVVDPADRGVVANQPDPDGC